MSARIIAVNAGPRKGWNTDTLITEASRGAAAELKIPALIVPVLPGIEPDPGVGGPLSQRQGVAVLEHLVAQSAPHAQIDLHQPSPPSPPKRANSLSTTPGYLS